MFFGRYKNIFKLCTIILTFSWEFIEGMEDHKINLKLGFDLIPSADGNPSVRVRDFEDFNLRKMGRKAEEMSARGEDSSPESDENKDDEKEDKDSDAVAVESSDSDEKALRSTKGIHPDEFEPETHAKLHNRGKQFDTETEER